MQYCRPILIIVFQIGITALLVAYVGGGNGITYTGNSNPAVITTNNAATLVANVMGDTAVSGAITASRGIADAPSKKSGQVCFTRQLSQLLRDTLTQSITARSAELRLSAKIDLDETDSCESGSIPFTGTLKDNGTGTLTASFREKLNATLDIL